MRCPYCLKEIFYRAENNMVYLSDTENYDGFEVTMGFCPACNELIVLYREGEVDGAEDGLEVVRSEKLILPVTGYIMELPVEVPKEYRDDFKEACLVQNLSPKSSAALSRRCLQRFLENEMNIKKSSLQKEIDEFVKTKNFPSIIVGAVDAIRNVGNLAAHPLKDTSTGQIVDVEPGEAEWILSVLEALFDYHFVQPVRLQKKKAELNQKLALLNKPLMK
ncbi:MAG TPA: hypothetical protein DEF42_10385 [Desulfosporosinus sp.]|nr:hypothetical protein [Desulfosporosinus sp.]